MDRYTKKDADGLYYIESANGKLVSDKFGHTYGEAIDRFAELESADLAEQSKVDFLQKTIADNAQKALEVALEEIEKAKQEEARDIFEEIEKYRSESGYVFVITAEAFDKLKKKHTQKKFDKE